MSNWIVGRSGNGYGYGVEARHKETMTYELHGIFPNERLARICAQDLIREYSQYEYCKVVKVELVGIEKGFYRASYSQGTEVTCI